MEAISDQNYEWRAGRVVCLATGAAVPQDEPVCVLLGGQPHALRILRLYQQRFPDESSQASIGLVIAEFTHWASLGTAQKWWEVPALTFGLIENGRYCGQAPAPGEPVCLLRASDPWAVATVAIANDAEEPAESLVSFLGFADRRPERMGAAPQRLPFVVERRQASFLRAARLADRWAVEVLQSEFSARQVPGGGEVYVSMDTARALEDLPLDVIEAVEWLRDRDLVDVRESAVELQLTLTAMGVALLEQEGTVIVDRLDEVADPGMRH